MELHTQLLISFLQEWDPQLGQGFLNKSRIGWKAREHNTMQITENQPRTSLKSYCNINKANVFSGVFNPYTAQKDMRSKPSNQAFLLTKHGDGEKRPCLETDTLVSF